MATPDGGGEPPPQPNLPPLGRTFAAVAKGQPDPPLTAVQLAPRHYGKKDGKPSVSFTQSELQPGVQRLQHSLIAKFSAGRPRIDEVRLLLSQAWGLDTPVTIGAMDARHVLIILHSAPMANRILAHPTRKIGNYLFRLFRWSQNFKRNKEPSLTTAWIRLPGLPAELFNAGYIAAIAGIIGRFLAIDEGTRTCRNPSFARACIELDLQKPLPTEIWIDLGISGGFWQPIEFENKLLYCSHCKLHGHQVDSCRKHWGEVDCSSIQATLNQSAEQASKNSDLLALEAGRKNKESELPEARVHGSPGVKNKAKDKLKVKSKDNPSIASSFKDSHCIAKDKFKDNTSLASSIVKDKFLEHGWTVVRKKKGKKQQYSKDKRTSSTNQSEFVQQDTSPSPLGTPTAAPRAVLASQMPFGRTANSAPSLCPRPIVISLFKGSKDEMHTSPNQINKPPTHATHAAPTASSNPKNLPHATILSRTKGLENINNKLSACIIYKRRKGESIPINSPRSASKRSAATPGFLSPRLLCLPIRDVNSSPV